MQHPDCQIQVVGAWQDVAHNLHWKPLYKGALWLPENIADMQIVRGDFYSLILF